MHIFEKKEKRKPVTVPDMAPEPVPRPIMQQKGLQRER
jgi:hypothetical protein